MAISGSHLAHPAEPASAGQHVPRREQQLTSNKAVKGDGKAPGLHHRGQRVRQHKAVATWPTSTLGIAETGQIQRGPDVRGLYSDDYSGASRAYSPWAMRSWN
jgi:hypothetical protein